MAEVRVMILRASSINTIMPKKKVVINDFSGLLASFATIFENPNVPFDFSKSMTRLPNKPMVTSIDALSEIVKYNASK